MNTSKTILITPLNWGLGHATRCIPLIRAFIRKNWHVVLASDGRALGLLKAEFPQLPCLELPPYNIKYPSENMLWNMAWQAPKMMRAIRREHAVIEDIVRKYVPKVILSDNRFGCFSNATLNIFLTHQIHLQTPLSFFNPVANLFNHHFIKNFNQCWVPDFEGIPNLSGRLSHGKPPIPTRYIGPLSRMKFEKRLQKFEVIAVLSGPEPQRTFLEEQLIRQSEKTGITMLLVQGKTEQRQTDIPYKNIRRVSFMTSEKLNEAILESGIVICRSGYSSVMDLTQLKKKALLIPTPGQTEQIYLAKRLKAQGIFYAQNQSKLNLYEDIQMAKSYTGFENFPSGDVGMNRAIEDLDRQFQA